MIKVISFENEDWNIIVKSFKEYDVYYLKEYLEAFVIHGDGIPELIYFQNKDLKAINVVMKRNISDFRSLKDYFQDELYYDYSSPYGYGGFLLEGNKSDNNIRQLKSEYEELCFHNKIVSEFVRFHPLINNANCELKELYEIIELGQTISIPLTDQKHIWNNLSGKNRNVIRKAIKNGVKIYWGRSPELYEQFIAMYNKTMDKDNAAEYYYFKKEFYDSVLYTLKYNSLIFYAMIDDKIIAMSIIMFCNKSIHYHLSASDKNYLSYAPTNLLLYEVACWGADNGYEKFHLGGGLGSQEDSLFKFKRSFVKEYQQTYFCIGKKIMNKPIYSELVEFRNKQENSELNLNNYFPEYRK